MTTTKTKNNHKQPNLGHFPSRLHCSTAAALLLIVLLLLHVDLILDVDAFSDVEVLVTP